MLRVHELKGHLTGATWVMIGSLITIALFSKPVAVIALIFMSLGDTAAGIIQLTPIKLVIQAGKVFLLD